MEYFTHLLADLSGPSLLALLQIIWIDLLLSGDNAVVIALACRNLPDEQKRIGMLLGTGAAVALRILFAIIITQLMMVPGLKIIGGILLFWVAIKLFKPQHDTHNVQSRTNLWGAIWTIAIADAVMSLDNVLALAGAARGRLDLFILGVFLSIPLIIIGSSFFIKLLTRWPWLIWLGAGLLGWIAGDLIVSDPWMVDRLGRVLSPSAHSFGAFIGCGLVWFMGWWMYSNKDTSKKYSE
jgi:YjbE family integral membrane protein